MKKTTTALLAIILLASCHAPKTSGVKGKPDTTRVEVFYRLGKSARLDSSFRIIKDTFRLSGIDTTAGQADMSWVKDTTYFIPVVTDTAKKEIKWYGVLPAFVTEIHCKPLN